MAVRLNHTIVAARDAQASAEFLASVMGLPAPVPFGPFVTVRTDGDTTLDFMEVRGEITSQHYAFLVDEDDFDAIFGRVKERGVTYWSDHGHRGEGRTNTHDGGRGVYFDDPDGHALEIITRPYGSGS
ncbi:VOC family protein [Umezawaea tangerina]|uniref:Catechol 2,3-dioxygenase-like lactoylglutathione lyase family enzyme n=1 Tax=Umezawaea tangerina TaxID=84725 RepID=A0A2T0SDX1_9PSEU|nr:VOC family protein [Umezawaea tangerina]PRY31618.1 catechol 2,3-dioxygenase-like lactoylglutathione lyase family enzyme [Umezawaea tangerina]